MLRGVAVLSVILPHINIRIPFSGTFLGSIMPAMLFKILFWSGFYSSHTCLLYFYSTLKLAGEWAGATPPPA
jgi:hypothetical protein